MIHIQDLFESLRQRWKLAALLAVIVFAVIMALALIQPRLYAADSSLLVDVTQTDPTEDAKAMSPQVIDSVIGTQVDVLKSDLVLEEAAKRAGLPETAKGDTEAHKIENAAADLRRNLNIATDRGSNVIRMSFLNRDPMLAAKVVNLVADVFLEKQVELSASPERSNAKWFNERTAEVRKRFEDAQKRLSDFQRQNGIVGVDRMDLEADKVKSLSAALVAAQANSAEARSRSGSASDPAVAGATIVQDLEREAAMARAKAADMAKTLGPNHPSMLAAEAQVSQLQSALSAARATQARSLTAASDSAGRRQSELAQGLSVQQNKMISLSGSQDQLMILQRDVDAAKQTYDTVRQRFNEAALKSEVARGNASRLDRASPPLLPAKPNILLWFVAAVVLGALGGAGPILAMEIASPKVRSSTGTAKATEIDVIMDLTEVQTAYATGRFEMGAATR